MSVLIKYMQLGFFILLFFFFYGCSNGDIEQSHTQIETERFTSPSRGALLASRYQSLEELRSEVEIEYFQDMDGSDTIYAVKLKHKKEGVESVLKSGVSQGDILEAKNGDKFDQFNLLINSPYAISNRVYLNRIFILARFRNDLFGWQDVAFFNLAKAAVGKINTPEIAYKLARDSSEKGYLNSFNHITAQAIITSCFSEELADFIADSHELHTMPELISGKFTQEQLTDLNKNPIDNYVDMLNNEWGQEIGKKLKKKFKLDFQTSWTPQLLADYLNEIQSYYSWAFGIGLEPFRPEEELIKKFSSKLDRVCKGKVD